MQYSLRRGYAASTPIEYKTRLAAFCGFRPQKLIPIYCELFALQRLHVSARRIGRWRDRTRLCVPDAICDVYLRDTSDKHVPVSAPVSELMDRVCSTLGYVSELRPDAPTVVPLPVERYYRGGNFGSGRHVLVDQIELKGVGQNPCSARSDWRHRWGGQELDEAVRELVSASHADSCSPAGAVPVYATFFVGVNGAPAFFRHANEDAAVALLSVTARGADYLRLANLYHGPGGPCPPGVGPFSDVVSQYAALAAFGHCHFSPDPDNLTLTGALLDVGWDVISPVPPYGVIRHVSGRGRPVPSLREAIHDIIQRPEPLDRFCSSVAHLSALEQIREARRDSGLSIGGSNWTDEYLQQLAFHWLLRNGCSSELAAEVAESYAHLFCAYLRGTGESKETYLNRCRLRWISPERNREQRWPLMVDVDPGIEELAERFERSGLVHSALIRAYNHRRVPPLSTLGIARALRARAPQVALRRRLQRYISLNRAFNPTSQSQRRFAIVVRADDAAIRVSDETGVLQDLARGDVRLLCRLLRRGQLVLTTLTASWSHENRELVCTRPHDELLVEAVASILPGGDVIVVPLPIAHVR